MPSSGLKQQFSLGIHKSFRAHTPYTANPNPYTRAAHHLSTSSGHSKKHKMNIRYHTVYNGFPRAEAERTYLRQAKVAGLACIALERPKPSKTSSWRSHDSVNPKQKSSRKPGEGRECGQGKAPEYQSKQESPTGRRGGHAKAINWAIETPSGWLAKLWSLFGYPKH